MCVIDVESNELRVAKNFDDAIFPVVEHLALRLDLIPGETVEFFGTSGYEVSPSAGFVAEDYLTVVIGSAGSDAVGEPRNLAELAEMMSSSGDRRGRFVVPSLGASCCRVGEPDDQVARIDFSMVLLDEMEGTEKLRGNDLPDDRASCGKS